MREILQGLCLTHVGTIKIYVPDVCFVEGDRLEVYHTDPDYARPNRLNGVIAARTIFSVMEKMRKKYKRMLEDHFRKRLL